MRTWLLIMMWLTAADAFAAAEGSWQASGGGASLSFRGTGASSPALNPPGGTAGKVTLVAWRYRLNGPPPAGLEVKLCSGHARCIPLNAASGTTAGLNGLDAGQPMRFVWSVPGGGKLWPVLRVTSNQVIVNYR
ncbi:flagellar protein FlhE [Salmonella enterica subsp. enterica serovar Choleraesuis]|nr:flagellar protein FlhE [Salmonella enterica subsp. enterica serovar Choleraesuis]